MKLQDFTFSIHDREGALNADADALSCQAWPEVPSSGDDVADIPTAVSLAEGCVGPSPHRRDTEDGERSRKEKERMKARAQKQEPIVS